MKSESLKGNTMGRFQQSKGAGRGRSTTNRNNSRNNGRNYQNSNTNNARKGWHDYVYSLGKQSADYDIITKYLILHIRKTFNNGDDIGNALETMQDVSFNAPQLEMSKSDDAGVKAREDKQFEMMFEAKLTMYLKQEETYRINKEKAYAFIFGQCSKIMQAKIMERKDYDNAKRDPI